MTWPAPSQLAAAKYQCPASSTGPAEWPRGGASDAACTATRTRQSSPIPSSQPPSQACPAIRHWGPDSQLGQNHSVAVCPAVAGSAPFRSATR